MDLFSLNREKNLNNFAPLASRMRPESLDDFVGQEDILAEGKALRRNIERSYIPSMIFYGPPGTGKTSLAYIISKETSSEFEKLSAVSSGKKDIEAVVKMAKDNLGIYNKRTILFIDEIHRFNKAQQDYLLPYVEKGLVTLIGATTENPFVSVNKALLSRCQLVELKELDRKDIKSLLKKALSKDKKLREVGIHVDDEALDFLALTAGGDARSALNNLEIAIMSTDKASIGLEDMEEAIQKRVFKYDQAGDDHYNTISAFIKSVRGSDAQAAIYYLAKMLLAGEDPVFIARRLVILASEDIGLADPQAMAIAGSCMYAVKSIGMPEARIPLAETCIYLAQAPKSNSAYLAIDKAMDFVKKSKNSDIPAYLRDGHFPLPGNKPESYLYPHNYGGYVDQVYLPEGIKNEIFYEAKDIGEEGRLQRNLDQVKKRKD